MTTAVAGRANWQFACDLRTTPTSGTVGRGSDTAASVVSLSLRRGDSPAARTSAVFDDLISLVSEQGISQRQTQLLNIAMRFLIALPRHVPVPELAVDNDGELLFDWYKAPGRYLTVALREDGRLSYAYRKSADDNEHGTKRFSKEIPQRIVELALQFSAT